MRTTLTLEDDVAAELVRLQSESRRTWKQTVNDVLRAGMSAVESTKRTRGRAARTRSVRLGAPMVGDVGNVHELLSLVEGDAHR
jgi:hypothetical protein